MSSDPRGFILFDDGYWAAKKAPAPPEVTLAEGNLFVTYYGSDQAGEVAPENFLPFSTTLELAKQTENPTILAAIEAAIADAPKRAMPPPAPRAHPPPARKQQREAAASKTEETTVDATDTELAAARDRLKDAHDAADVKAATDVLLNLSRTRVTFDQLKRTHVGVAVGNLRLNKAFQSRWKLVDGILQWWAGITLSEETKAAWTRYRATRRTEHDDNTSAAPLAGGATDAPQAGKTTIGFADRLLVALARPEEVDELGLSKADVDAVVQEWSRACNTRELKDVLLEAISKDGNKLLRGRVLNRDLAPREFFEMSDAERMTQEERNQAAAMLEQKLKDKEESDLSLMGAPSEMYLCEKCGERKTRYTTQQTRGADEPETVFITCMACGARWTFN